MDEEQLDKEWWSCRWLVRAGGRGWVDDAQPG